MYVEKVFMMSKEMTQPQIHTIGLFSPYRRTGNDIQTWESGYIEYGQFL